MIRAALLALLATPAGALSLDDVTSPAPDFEELILSIGEDGEVSYTRPGPEQCYDKLDGPVPCYLPMCWATGWRYDAVQSAIDRLAWGEPGLPVAPVSKPYVGPVADGGRGSGGGTWTPPPVIVTGPGGGPDTTPDRPAVGVVSLPGSVLLLATAMMFGWRMRG